MKMKMKMKTKVKDINARNRKTKRLLFSNNGIFNYDFLKFLIADNIFQNLKKIIFKYIIIIVILKLFVIYIFKITHE